jgi:DNA-binding NtrC family response regulator
MEYDLNQNIQIWIAEDEEELLELLCRALAREGRIIKPYKDGKEVLKEIEKATFDILLTDLMMPEVDGIQLLRESKKIFPESIVIIMTGYASLDSAIQSIRGGAYDYIRKPFKIEELEIVIQNACEKIILQRENRYLIQKLKEMMEDTRRLKEVWEERLMAMMEICRAIAKERDRSEIELFLKQAYSFIPKDKLDVRKGKEKSIKIFNYLIEIRNEGLINDEELTSLLKIFLEKFQDRL